MTRLNVKTASVTKKIILLVWSHLSNYKIELIVLWISLTFLSMSNLIYPWLLKVMVDGRSVAVSDVNYFLLILVVLFIAAAIVGVYTETILQKLGFYLRNSLRRSLYESLLNRPLAYHRESKAGMVSSLMTEDIGKAQSVFSAIVGPLYQNTLFEIGCVILMCKINIMATGIVLLIIILLLPVMAFYSKTFRNLSMIAQKQHAEANAVFEESLVAIREVQSFGLECQIANQYRFYQEQAFQTEMRSAKINPRLNQITRLFLSGILLVIFYIGISEMSIPNWSVGGSVAFYMYAYSLTMTILSTGRLVFSFQSVLGAVERTMVMLTHSQPSPQGSHHQDVLTGQVLLENVSFEYSPQRSVLCNVSASIAAGTWVVIKGPSGSGKSTIASLLMGFYQPMSGNIFIDAVPVSSWDIRNLRSHMGYVGQDPVLFHGTLRENILLERYAYAHRLDYVLKICCLDHFIQELPGGIDTTIGERGLTLSAGQRSRVAVARALLTHPNVLILDEANSMLESELEDIFWKNIWSDRKDKTTLILTHHDEKLPKGCQIIHLEKNIQEPHYASALS